MKVIKIIFSLLFLFAIGSNVTATQPKYWMCTAVAEKVLGTRLTCDATATNINKKIASNKAVQKCNNDCPTKCKPQLCIPIGY